MATSLPLPSGSEVSGALACLEKRGGSKSMSPSQISPCPLPGHSSKPFLETAQTREGGGPCLFSVFDKRWRS